MLERDDPRIAGHPLRDRHNWKEKTIPIALLSDAIPCVQVGKAGAKSLDVWSWQSLFSHGKTNDIKELVYSVFEQNKSENTMDQVWKVLAWSFDALYRGRFPSVDVVTGEPFSPDSADGLLAGKELAGGWCGVIWKIKGDLDFFAEGFRLPHYCCNKFCPNCPADAVDPNPAMWPSTFRKSAP